MLKQRILTVLLLAPLILWAVYQLPEPYFSIMVAVLILAAAFEFSKLIGIHWLIIVPLTGALMWVSLQLADRLQIQLLGAVLLWWLVNLYWVLSYPNLQNFWYGSKIKRLINVLLTLVPTFLSLVLTRQWLGEGWLFLLIGLVWGADIGAYFAGRRFGKNKLAPHVSPGKTLEGVIGGMILATAVSIVVLYLNHVPIHKWIAYLLLTLIVVWVSILGDLYESLYKRAAHFKESGVLLPGHGGILDRIDSLTSASPLFLLGCLLLEKL